MTIMYHEYMQEGLFNHHPKSSVAWSAPNSLTGALDSMKLKSMSGMKNYPVAFSSLQFSSLENHLEEWQIVQACSYTVQGKTLALSPNGVLN